MTAEALLEVKELSLEFHTRDGQVRALEDVSFEVSRGEILGIVGESGSGKSVSAYAIMDLLDKNAEIKSGSMHFAGADLLANGRAALKTMRGREISMIFQSPRTALNPIRSVGKQIEDVLLAPRSGAAAERQAGGHLSASPGADSRSRAALRGLSLRAVGRHVPARHDRYGTRLPADAAYR